MKRILFVCTENACRSQMAEAFARALGGKAVEVYSAGSHPASTINPATVAVMAEVGIDVSRARPKGLEELPVRQFDLAVAMGCGDACPRAWAKHQQEWQLPNPSGMSLEQFRALRDDIRRRVETLLNREVTHAAPL